MYIHNCGCAKMDAFHNPTASQFKDWLVRICHVIPLLVQDFQTGGNGAQNNVAIHTPGAGCIAFVSQMGLLWLTSMAGSALLRHLDWPASGQALPVFRRWR